MIAVAVRRHQQHSIPPPPSAGCSFRAATVLCGSLSHITEMPHSPVNIARARCTAFYKSPSTARRSAGQYFGVGWILKTLCPFTTSSVSESVVLDDPVVDKADPRLVSICGGGGGGVGIESVTPNPCVATGVDKSHRAHVFCMPPTSSACPPGSATRPPSFHKRGSCHPPYVAIPAEVIPPIFQRGEPFGISDLAGCSRSKRQFRHMAEGSNR